MFLISVLLVGDATVKMAPNVVPEGSPVIPSARSRDVPGGENT